MKIAVGIFAYNEERNIAATIASLGQQDLLCSDAHSVTIHVIPNGCKDQTAARAQAALDELRKNCPLVQCRVDTIVQGGKANAWNEFVHAFADKDSDSLLFLDADIRFGELECLSRVVLALEANPEVIVSVDLPLKDIVSQSNPSMKQQLSLAASELQSAGPPKIAGSLYLARMSALRDVWLPNGIIVEDGFVKAMLLTQCFTQPENTKAIVRAKDATHYFEALVDFQKWFQHERRLVCGTAVNILLFDRVRKEVAEGRSAGEFIRIQNETNPLWVSEYVRAYRGGLPGTWDFLLSPIRQWWAAPTLRKIRGFPAAAIRSVLNVAVVFVSSRELRSGRLRW